MPQTCIQNVIQKSKFLENQPQYTALLNKVFIFSLIFLYLAKYFWKHETFLQYIIANMKVESVVLLLHYIKLCCYQHYSLGRISPTFIRCLYAVFGYKHFLTTINYFRRRYTTLDGNILLLTAIYYFWRPCKLSTVFGGHILLLTAIYYFCRLCIAFDGQILLLALPYCDFCKSPRLSCNFPHLWIKSQT